MKTQNKLLLSRPLFILLMLLSINAITLAQDSSFYFGVDLSYVNEVEDCGAIYRENGVARDPYELFAERGANLVRARLWHNPDWTNYSTLEDVKRTFQRAKDAGMSTLLDFHYSDNWADPGRQEIPAAWEDIEDTDQLADTLYQYTYDVLSELHTADLTPDLVQIGNETNSGLLKRVVELDWSRDALLFNAGIRAVRDFAEETGTNPKVLLHVAQPQNTGWWFSGAEQAGLTDFDIIGVSYYPQWSTFSIADMGAQVSYLRQRFGKQVMVLETGYGWTREAVDETADNVLNQGLRGYSFSPDGQFQFMIDLTQSLISNGASGVVYWEPAWLSTSTCSTRWGQGSHWENATFFDFQNDNEVLVGINFLNQEYIYPALPLDGLLEADYEALVEDSLDDVLDEISAIDLHELYMTADANSLSLALTIAGDIYSERGYYLIYFDTTQDENGADVDVARRPITVADPYQPEFRLDISIKEESGTIGGRYTWNAWTGTEWEEMTFTGGAAIVSDEESLIEIQIPHYLLDNPQRVNVAVISSDSGRSHTAGDILGSDFHPSDWSEAIVIEDFFSFELTD